MCEIRLRYSRIAFKIWTIFEVQFCSDFLLEWWLDFQHVFQGKYAKADGNKFRRRQPNKLANLLRQALKDL